MDSVSQSATGVSATFLRQFLADCNDALTTPLNRATTTDVCMEVVKPRTHPVGTYMQHYTGAPGSAAASSEFVGPANVFVSHAWRYRFRDVVQAMLEYQENNPGMTCYFWFDLFVNDQNNASNNDFNWWCTTFRSSIESIGKVLLVLSPWKDPVPLTRAWCLWEIFCAADNANVQFDVHIADSEKLSFLQSFVMDYSVVLDTLVRVQAERAEATNPADKEMIFKAIASTPGGFKVVNEKVKDQMRDWLLEAAVSFVQQMEAEGQGDGPLHAGACENVGILLNDFGRHDEALLYQAKVLKYRRRHHADDIRSRAITEMNIGNELCHSGDLSKAVAKLKLAISLLKEAGCDETETMAGAHNNLSYALWNLAQRDRSQSMKEAIFHAQKSLVIRRRVLPPNHENTATCYTNLGRAYRTCGNNQQAFHCYMSALAMKLKTLGQHNPSTASEFNNLGELCFQEGYADMAITLLKKSLDIKCATIGADHHLTALTYGNLAMALQRKSDVPAALRYATRAHNIFCASQGPGHPNAIRAKNLLEFLQQAQLQ